MLDERIDAARVIFRNGKNLEQVISELTDKIDELKAAGELSEGENANS